MRKIDPEDITMMIILLPLVAVMWVGAFAICKHILGL
jgi:hypothetical protein